MATIEATQASTITELNDRFRQGDHSLGQVVTTPGVNDLSSENQQELFRLLRTFDDFTPENDPYGEHNRASFEFKGDQYCWKIDYYTPDLKHGSQDPSDPTVTTRVLTLMHVSEY